MIPRLHISFSVQAQKAFCWGKPYSPSQGEFLLNHARAGIVMALRAAIPHGGLVGVVAYNCHTVANAVVEAGCTPVFVDVTEDLQIDVQHLSSLSLDAIVITNLFGIRNNIATIQTVQPNAILLVDNAHGYGLPAEGDFTVYSINQGKFPALGAGGLLWVNHEKYLNLVEQQYTTLSIYSRSQELKLFATMLAKAWMHIPCIYGLVTRKMKAHRGRVECREHVVLRRMAKGVCRMYQQALPKITELIQQQRTNAQYITNKLQNKQFVEKVWYGQNAFMVIARTTNPLALKQYLATYGIEAATHFAKAIEWAEEFGYIKGQCPVAEKMTNELIMIPTYKKIKL